jgi:pyridoxine/pyridoxamine 5'-phosphate oxidase
MTRTKNKSTVDCVDLKRQAQAKIYAETKDLAAAEQIEYFRRRAETGVLGAWWKRVSGLTADVSPLVMREKPGKYGK